MPTSPSKVRRGLQIVTAAAQADVQTVAAATSSPTELRAALLAATPLIVSEYIDGAAALALDWYEEIRDAAGVVGSFTPSPLTLVTEDDVRAMVAALTGDLRDRQREIDRQIETEAQRIVDNVAAEVQKEVASGFWDTATGNAAADPEAVGWQRFARDGACKFCLMLSGKGSVYSETTANFAAHTNCNCVVGPAFDPDAPKADVMQYVASKRKRTAKERAALRKYLNQNFPDAPG